MNTSDRPLLKLEGIGKQYGSRQVLDGLHLEVREGERFFILGPSGCGKTTLLRIIAGLDPDHDGSVEIRGETVSGGRAFKPPHQRGIGFVFQDGALWPHLTVEKHLTYGEGASDRRQWHDQLLELCGLADRRKDYPSTLSGGEKQRLALARALSNQPALLLFDEPLRNLDRNLAIELRKAIVEILEQTKTTSIFVTHDQEEALSMAHRVLLMDDEGPVQCGRPEELYHAPATPWAASFFGPVNRFPVKTGAQGKAWTPAGVVETDLPEGTACEVLLRASQLEAFPHGEGVEARVLRHEFHGEVFLLLCEHEGIELHAFSRGFKPNKGTMVRLRICGKPGLIDSGGAHSAGTHST
ncbi:MAG: ABC transporter ATP-binding protein [Planctomycetota bacterium]